MGDSLAIVVVCLIYLSLGFNLAIGILDGQLILFHVYLKCKHMSTYQFIVMKRNQRHSLNKVSHIIIL